MRIEPFGFEIENWRAGMVAAAVCNELIRTRGVPRGKPRPKTLQPADFYPPLRGAKRSNLTPEQQAFIDRRKRHVERGHSND